MDPLFPALPENLAELSDEQLAELLTTYTEIEARLHDGDAELIGERSNADVLAEYETLVSNIEAVRTEQGAREDEATETRRKMDELHNRASGEPEDEETPKPPADDEDEDDEGDEEEADGEADENDDEKADEGEKAEEIEEPIAAAATPTRRFRAPVVARDREPDPDTNAVIVAAAEVPGFPLGKQLSLHQVGEMIIQKRRGFGTIPAGMSEDVTVASVYAEYPPERQLDMGDPFETWLKIKKVIGGVPGSKEQMAALSASGGLCAPTPVNYALDVIGSTATPVFDSLPGFQATRGGVRYTYPPTLADVTSAIGIITAAQDEAGGSAAIKGCQTVDCPTFVETLIDVVYTCLQFGNLQARTYPELVAAWQELLAIALANVMEVKTLDSIKAGSTQVNSAASEIGAIAEFYGVLNMAAAGWRSRWRLDRNAPLRVLLPQWLPNALANDLWKRPYEEFDDNDFAEIESFFGYLNLTPVYYMDSSTTGGQVFDAQAAGALEHYPSAVEWAMYPEGTWLALDGGTLDLGLVRDSALNSTNDYQLFAESFSNVARVGSQSIWGTTPICLTGAAGLGKTVACVS